MSMKGLWLMGAIAICALHVQASQRAPIELPTLAREELIAVALTSNILLVARDDYADLRVTTADGKAVPFLLQEAARPSMVARRIACPARPPQAREAGSNALELVYELEPRASMPTGLTVDTPLRDFHQRVKVETSSDGSAWQVVTEGAAIYGLARFIDVRGVDVAWQPRAVRWLRVTLLEAQSDRPSDVRDVTTLNTTASSGTTVHQTVRREPFRVDGIRFWREETHEGGRTPVLADYALARVSAVARADGSVFVFRGSRAPLTRITFATPDRLFSRAYRLYGRDAAAGWTEAEPGRLLASGTLTEVRFQDIARTAMTVAIPVSRFREYVLVCPAVGVESTEVTVARAEGLLQRVIFVAVPGRAYTLWFGDSSATVAMPEAREIRALTESGCQPVEARLGAVTGDAAGDARGTWRAWLNSSWAMIGAMAFAGVVLAVVLMRAGRKLR
jgi:hypothetical protein